MESRRKPVKLLKEERQRLAPRHVVAIIFVFVFVFTCHKNSKCHGNCEIR